MVSVTPFVRLELVSASHRLEVLFEEKRSEHLIEMIVGLGGRVVPEGQTIVKDGDSFAFTVEALPSYKILNVMVNGKSVGKPTQFVISDIHMDYSIEVTFISKTSTHMITERLVGAGHSEVLNKVGVLTGSSVKSVYYAPRDLKVVDVIVDDISYGALNSYTFNNIEKDHIITYVVEVDAFFRAAPPEVEGGGCQYSPSVPDHHILEILFLLLSMFAIVRVLRFFQR